MRNKILSKNRVNILKSMITKVGILAFFVVYTLATPMLFQKYVLCFGSDGHSAIESNTGITGKCCQPASKTHALPGNLITDQHSSCDGNCTDILLCSTFNNDSSSRKDIVAALSYTPVKSTDEIKIHHKMLNHRNIKTAPHLNTPLLSFETMSLLI